MRLLLIVVSFFTIALSTGIVFAQDASPSVTPQHGEEKITTHQEQPSPQPTEQNNQHQQEVEKKHQAFQEHLKQVQNKHHAQVAERIHQNLNHVNETVTSAWLKSVNHMSEIVLKLEDHLNTAAREGKNVSQAQTAVNNAKTQVSTAENALKTQAGKVYTITIIDPTHIEPDVKASRDMLHTDLNSVHEIVKNAKEAVVEATKIIDQTRGGTNGE